MSESVGTKAEPALRRAAEAIWVAAQRIRWSSLVLIPAEAHLSTAALAEAVAAVGAAQRGAKVEALDLRRQPLENSRSMALRLADETEAYRHVAAVDCPAESQPGLLFCAAAGAAVLVVEQGITKTENARRVIELVGPGRFVGAVVLTTPAP